MARKGMRPLAVLTTLALLYCGAALAQGVVVGQLTADDLLRLYDNAVVLEVEVPEGASTLAFSYGPPDRPNGLGSSLQEGPASRPTTVRIVTLLPDPSEVDPCAADEAEATLLVIRKYEDFEGIHHRQKVCVPHPAKSAISGSVTRIPQRDALALDQWTPVLIQAWLVNEGPDSAGAIESTLDLGSSFVVQLYFGSAEGDFPATESLTIEELAQLPVVNELIEEYGVLEQP